MADGHGGYRRPAHPAPVSGPGALSRRTDGRQPQMIASGGDYGERQAMQGIQSGAPMSGDIGSGGMAASAGGMAMPDPSSLVPMNADSQRPMEAITAGMSGGLGPGPSVLNQPSPLTDDQRERLRHFLPALVILASRDDADQNTRRLVRQLRAELG